VREVDRVREWDSDFVIALKEEVNCTDDEVFGKVAESDNERNGMDDVGVNVIESPFV
jgi:hypothetical protein